ncbi:MAG: hypothetical protein NY202_05145 [Mollicutes bacterium UO1]
MKASEKISDNLKFLKKLTFDDLGLSPPKGINEYAQELKLGDKK